MVSPPLTDSVWPVMYSAASDAKKATAAATSDGCAKRFMGTERVIPPITLSASCPELSANLRSAGVSVGPGHTVFAVTPLVATSRARVLVNAIPYKSDPQGKGCGVRVRPNHGVENTQCLLQVLSEFATWSGSGSTIPSCRG